MALQGKANVYAAVSMARGDRALYFTAPVYGERAKSTIGVGAVVARTTLDRVDKLLQNRFDVALLLSPQGVVFASNRPDWIGRLEGEATAQRLKAIRELRQFGAMFEKNDPERLPVAVHDGVQTIDGLRYAVASADVDWHDPSGQWKLVVMEDLTRTAPLDLSAVRAVGSAAAIWLLSWMVMYLFKGRHAQNLASSQLQHLAAQQEKELQFRTRLGAAMVRLQQSETMPALGEAFLSDAHALFGALQGVVYAREDGDRTAFALQAAFACSSTPPQAIRAGQGLLGQCAVEHTSRVMEVGEAGFWTVRSGLGATAPSALVMAPVIRNGDVLGLVELAVLVPPQAFDRESFAEFVHLLGLNLQILMRTEQVPTPETPSSGKHTQSEVAEASV